MYKNKKEPRAKRDITLWEDLALNCAAVLVVLVVLFPMSWKCGTEYGYCPSVNAHGWFAIAFYACIVYVALFESGKTLGELRDEAVRRRYGVAYLFTRASLVLFPAAATMAHMELREAQAAERHVFDEAAKAVD